MISLQIILTSASAPSGRVRYTNLLQTLVKSGFSCSVDVYPAHWFKKLSLIIKCRHATIVILQKKLLSIPELWLLSMTSKILVYDFDDAVFLRQKNGRAKRSKGREYKFIRTLKASDHVIVCNKHLAAHAIRHNVHTSIIPSSVEAQHLPSDNAERSGVTVIGWIGTSVNLPHLMLIAPILKQLAEDYEYELRVISSQPLKIPGVHVRFIPWRVETQADEIAQFDIGVMPLPRHEHAAGKCAYKALQCMMAAVPVVVSGVGMNSDVVTDGVDGMVAETIDQFYPKLKRLIEEPATRKAIGCAGHAKVFTTYSQETVAHQLAVLLKKIVQQSNSVQ